MFYILIYLLLFASLLLSPVLFRLCLSLFIMMPGVLNFAITNVTDLIKSNTSKALEDVFLFELFVRGYS